MNSTSEHLHFKHISISFGTKRKSPFIRINTQIPPLNIFNSSTYLFLLALKAGLYVVKQREEKRLVILTFCIKIIERRILENKKEKKKNLAYMSLLRKVIKYKIFISCKWEISLTSRYCYSYTHTHTHTHTHIYIYIYICLDEHILAFKVVKCFLPFM